MPLPENIIILFYWTAPFWIFLLFFAATALPLDIHISAIKLDHCAEARIISGDRGRERFRDFLAAQLAVRRHRDIEDDVRVRRS